MKIVTKVYTSSAPDILNGAPFHFNEMQPDEIITFARITYPRGAVIPTVELFTIANVLEDTKPEEPRIFCIISGDTESHEIQGWSAANHIRVITCPQTDHVYHLFEMY